MGSHVLFRGPGERPPPAGSHETHQGPPGHSPVQVIREEDLSGTRRSRQGGSNPEPRLEDGEGLDGLSAPASVTALLGDPTQENHLWLTTVGDRLGTQSFLWPFI